MQLTYREADVKLKHRIAQWGLAAVVIWTLIGVAVLGYFSGGVISVLSIPMGILLFTCVIVFTLRGSVNKLSSKGVPRGLAVTICFLVLIAVVVLLCMLLAPVFSVDGSMDDMLGDFASYVVSVQDFANDLYATYPHVFANPTVSAWIDSGLASLGTAGEEALSGLAQSVVKVTSFTLNAVMVLMFSLITSFWLLLEMPRVRGELGRLLGEKAVRDADFLADTCSRVLAGFIKGMLLQCVLIGVCCGATFAIIGVDNGPILAVVIGFCNILPVLGQWIALAIVAVACIFGDGITALLVIVSTLIIQRLFYTFIYPKIMADSVDVHPVLIIIVMMIGYALGMAMGSLPGALAGILISIPLAAVAKAIFVLFFERRTGRHLVAEDGVFFKGVPNSEEEPDPLHNAVAPHPIAYAQTRTARRRRGKLYIQVEEALGRRVSRDDQDADQATEQPCDQPTEKEEATSSEAKSE